MMLMVDEDEQNTQEPPENYDIIAPTSDPDDTYL